MAAVFVIAFALILGVISFVPLHSNNPIIKNVLDVVVQPTNAPTTTPTPTLAPTSHQLVPTIPVSPTLQIKPIIRHEDD